MLLLEIDYWKILESISICLTFLVSSITLYYFFKEYKKHNEEHNRKINIEELNFYLNMKTEVLKPHNKLLIVSILENNIGIIQRNGIDVLVRYDNNSPVVLEVDLLQRIEDLYYFHVTKNLISLDSISHGYGSMIGRLRNCEVIQEFINRIRVRENEPEIWIGLEVLYQLIYPNT